MFKSKTLDHLNIIFSFLPKVRKKQFFSLVPIAILAGTSEVIVLGICARLFSFIVGEPRKSLPLNDYFNFDPKYKLLILIIIFILTNWFAGPNGVPLGESTDTGDISPSIGSTGA